MYCTQEDRKLWGDFWKRYDKCYYVNCDEDDDCDDDCYDKCGPHCNQVSPFSQYLTSPPKSTSGVKSLAILCGYNKDDDNIKEMKKFVLLKLHPDKYLSSKGTPLGKKLDKLETHDRTALYQHILEAFKALR